MTTLVETHIQHPIGHHFAHMWFDLVLNAAVHFWGGQVVRLQLQHVHKDSSVAENRTVSIGPAKWRHATIVLFTLSHGPWRFDRFVASKKRIQHVYSHTLSFMIYEMLSYFALETDWLLSDESYRPARRPGGGLSRYHAWVNSLCFCPNTYVYTHMPTYHFGSWRRCDDPAGHLFGTLAGREREKERASSIDLLTACKSASAPQLNCSRSRSPFVRPSDRPTDLILRS